MKKVYFCGSIKGGRADAELYGRLISRMGEKGFRVLTEHVGAPDVLELEEVMTDRQIWEQDMGWLAEADLVVAECSIPSLGVGYELAEAKRLGKPVTCFWRVPGEKGLSAMIAGDPYYSLRPYASEEELFLALEEVLDAAT